MKGILWQQWALLRSPPTARERSNQIHHHALSFIWFFTECMKKDNLHDCIVVKPKTYVYNYVNTEQFMKPVFKRTSTNGFIPTLAILGIISLLMFISVKNISVSTCNTQCTGLPQALVNKLTITSECTYRITGIFRGYKFPGTTNIYTLEIYPLYGRQIANTSKATFRLEGLLHLVCGELEINTLHIHHNTNSHH